MCLLIFSYFQIQVGGIFLCNLILSNLYSIAYLKRSITTNACIWYGYIFCLQNPNEYLFIENIIYDYIFCFFFHSKVLFRKWHDTFLITIIFENSCKKKNSTEARKRDMEIPNSIQYQSP